MSLAVEKESRAATFRPYLDRRGPLHLRISLVSDDIQNLEKTLFPFQVMTESDPFARLIEACFITDSESELRRVFMLVQRDRYLLGKNEWRPITNLDVEDAWQKAFSFYRDKGGRSRLMVLSEQIGGAGSFMPFQSLFFCKVVQLFFPPPCPRCGRPLEQCYEDALLSRLELRPYSTSLRRYLFCPVCYRIGQSDFYVFELESSDPPGLKDRWDLMKAFRLLLETSHTPCPFPCRDCSRRQECYGSNPQVLSRLAPFSFYPFYTFIWDAPSLHGLDFLSLVSGASPYELAAHLKLKGEGGRLNCMRALEREGLTNSPFLFEGDERHFLEVLYLKLSFLGELFKIISSDLDRHPDLPVSIERIWVDLKEHEGLLPFFWNFRVRAMDGVGPVEEIWHPVMRPTSRSLYYLGLAWFYVLLVNRRQDLSTVRLSLRQITDRFPLEKGFSLESFLKEHPDPTFLPENIFWNPEDRTVNTDGCILWEKALGLGWLLLRAGLHQDPGGVMDTFWQGFEDLRDETKRKLFRPEIRRDHRIDISGAREESKAIHAMLIKIMSKWRIGAEPAAEELKETVILAPDRSAEPALPETVILSTSEVMGEPAFASIPETREAPSSPEEIPLKDTLSRKKESFPADFLTETVILGPGLRSPAPSSFSFRSETEITARGEGKAKAIPPKAEEVTEDEDLLAETVVQKPGERPARGQEKKRTG